VEKTIEKLEKILLQNKNKIKSIHIDIMLDIFGESKNQEKIN